MNRQHRRALKGSIVAFQKVQDAKVEFGEDGQYRMTIIGTDQNGKPLTFIMPDFQVEAIVSAYQHSIVQHRDRLRGEGQTGQTNN